MVDREPAVVVVSEKIFPARECDIALVVSRPAPRFIVRYSSRILSLLPLNFDSILHLGLCGRRKRCVNHAR